MSRGFRTAQRNSRTLRFETLELRQLLTTITPAPLIMRGGGLGLDASDQAHDYEDLGTVALLGGSVSSAWAQMNQYTYASSQSSPLNTSGVADTRMTDAEFFGSVNLALPGLEAVRVAVTQHNWPSARAAFAQYFRTRALPRWFFIQSEPPATPSERPDTTVADRLLQHQWQFQGVWYDLGPDIDWSSNQLDEGSSATLSWSATLNRHFHFADLANAYVGTGEEKYAAEIVTEMLDWIEDCPVLEDSSGNDPYHYAWETLSTGCRAMESWPNALYSIMPSQALTADALVTIVKSLAEHARHLDRWATDLNWLSVEMSGLATVGTLLAESNEAGPWRAHAIQRLYQQMQTEVYPDGMECELALGYSNMVLESYTHVLELLKLNNRAGELPSGYLAQLQRMYEYQVYAMMPNFRVPGLNDSADKWPFALLRSGYSYFPDREDFLWGATAGQEGQVPETTSTAFSYGGHYVMRSGWDADARYLLLDAGPFGAAHQHEDKLHFIAYAYGQQLLLDSGLYKYDASTWRAYVLSTAGHNTILVNGQGQDRRDAAETWTLPTPVRPLDNTWATDEGFDFVVGQYDSGYGSGGAIDVTHTRAIVFLKPEYWVIVDTLQPKDTTLHTYDSLFHMNADAAVIDPATKSVTTLNTDSANVQLWPVNTSALSVRVVQGQEDPVQGWSDKPWRPVPTADYRLQGRGTQRLVTVVYPLQPGQISPIASVQSVPVLIGGVRAGDAVACEIRFSDGRVDRVMVAEDPGTQRSYGGTKTSAMMHATRIADGGSQTLQYPDAIGPQDPEIQVFSGTTELIDGTGSIALGSTAVGTPLSRTFTVKNLGPGNLVLTAPITVPAGFTVVSSFGSTNLAPNASTSFTVRLNATTANAYSGTLSFGNNDADENPFNFTISGTVTASGPEIQVLDGTVDIADGTGVVNFGNTPVGTSVKKTFTVKNVGTRYLRLRTPITVPTGFRVTSSFGRTYLAPKASTTFTVRLNGSAVGAYSGKLSFNNNDANENPFDFMISGMVGSSVATSSQTLISAAVDQVNLSAMAANEGSQQTATRKSPSAFESLLDSSPRKRTRRIAQCVLTDAIFSAQA